MVGHGWVNPLPDGSRARCGGPGLCAHCKAEQADRDQVLVAAAAERIRLSVPAPKEEPAYRVEEHILGGEAVWVALRARGADFSWLRPDECVQIARNWIALYGPKESAG